MQVKKQKTYYFIFYAAFIIFNVINTYFLTSQVLNKYISPISRTFIGEITSIFGNASILLLFIIIGIAIFKKDRSRFVYLISVTLFLNVIIFILGFFNLFYSTAFSVNALQLLKNPASGITSGLFTELIGELFLNFRILVFIPTAVLTILYILYKEQIKKTGIELMYQLNGITTLVLLSSFVFLIGGSSTSYLLQMKNDDFLLGATASTKGIQNYGVYPYYITNFLDINFEVTTRESMGLNTPKDINESYERFNKNQSSYQNIIDGKMYSNELLLGDSKITAHDSLNLNDDSCLTGLFKDKNLVLVQMESLNYFLLQIEDSKKQFEFANKLFEESFFFENYYSSVGLGGTSDAESSVLTGLNMNGYSTFYRSYDFNNYQIDTLPNLFKGYDSLALHGGFEEFYNRKGAYPELLKFTEDFISIEDFANEAGFDDPYKYHKERMINGYDYPHYKYDNKLNIKTPWPSEFELSDKVYEQLENVNKQFTYSVFMTPHTPFLFNSAPGNISNNNINNITKRYLDFGKIIDNSIEAYFIDPKTGNERPNIEDNVYIFYSDHGSSIKNGDLAKLFNKQLSIYEERRILQQLVAFIYAPSKVKTETKGINEGLIKGRQNLTRSHVDLYRTIGELFGLFDETNFFFGVSGFSNEPSYALDNRVQDVIVDDVRHINDDDYVPMFLSLRNDKFRSSEYNEVALIDEDKIMKYLKSFRKHSDLILNDKFMYEDYKKTLQK